MRPKSHGGVQLQAEALHAHEQLNQINEEPRHNLGLAAQLAKEKRRIDATQARRLQSPREKANRARHVWQEQKHPEDISKTEQCDKTPIK